MKRKSKTYSERELIKGCLKNDRFYQERFYRRFAPTMLRMCYRYTRDEHQALEIVNDGFLQVFQKLDTYQASGSLEGWIRKIVFRSLSDYFRKENRRIRFLDLESKDQPNAQQALPDLYLEDLLDLVKSLPEMHGRVFHLYAIEGYNHREIGGLLGIPEGTSKWYLSEARKQLRRLIQLYYKHRNYAG